MIPITRTPDPYEPWLLSLGFTTRHFHVLSGHASLDDNGRFVPGTFADQARVTLDGIRKSLAAAGGSLDNVVKLVAFVTDIARDESTMRSLVASAFAPPLPALTIVEITMRRHPEWLLELDALAVVGGIRRVARQESRTARTN